MTTGATGVASAPHFFLSGRPVPVLGFGCTREAHRLHSANFSLLDIAGRFSPSKSDTMSRVPDILSSRPRHQDPVRPVSIQGCNVFVSSASLIMPARRDNAIEKGLFRRFVCDDVLWGCEGVAFSAGQTTSRGRN